MTPSLDGVRAKIGRAEEHLKVAAELADVVRDGHSVIRKKGYDPNFTPASPEYVSLFLKLRQPREDFVLIVGDCVHNLRTSLDHLVWQLVLLNGGTPTTSNMFPICDTHGAWVGQLKRDRLCGVSLRAKTLIEGLQPYVSATNAPLWVLSELENIDKHRTLLSASAMLIGQRVTFVEPDGRVGIEATVAGGLERDGAHLLGFDFGATDIGTGDDMEVQLEGTAYVAFEDAPVRDVPVIGQLRQCVEFVKDAVVPRFDPFF